VEENKVRLQKVLAAAGLGSRRKCEEFIIAGRVSVNGVVMDELGCRVDPDADIIHVDNVRIAQTSGHVVVALNKPRGIVTTMTDPQGRACVGDIVKDFDSRLFHIGRLDSDTEGLLLLTNDGELSQLLSHPSFGIAKTYLARVKGRIIRDTMREIEKGVVIEGKPVAIVSAKLVESSNTHSVIEISIHEGRNRILRKMFDEVGHPVVDLVRTQIGPIKLGNLKVGSIRTLSNQELGTLYSIVGL